MNNDIIDRYLLRRMNQAERAAFKKQLESDPALQERVSDRAEYIYSIQANYLKKKLKNESFTDNDRKKKILLYLFLGILLAIIAVYFILTHSSAAEDQAAAEYYASYFEPDPGLPSKMGGNDAEYAFADGMVDYRRGNYASAITKWESLIGSAFPKDTLHYFLGNACQALGRLKESADHYIIVLEQESQTYENRARHRLGIISLDNGEVQKARSYLEKAGLPESEQLLRSLDE